jgi:hypothetical protein
MGDGYRVASMADASTPPTRDPGEADEQPPPCVGVLFVHGAGDHATGSTLIEFGQALVAWLDGWLRQGAEPGPPDTDGAFIGVTQILVREGDTQAPAHSSVRLRPKARPGAPPPDEHTWLLAESHWDDAFSPPSAQQVLVWAITVVPWVLITQLIGPLQRRAKLVRPTPIAVFGYLWRVIVATIVSLIATFFTVALIIVTLVLGLIPVDSVRQIVSRLQRFAETGVGDLYVVLTSPVQRAALVGAVQRDIQWLRDRGAKRVAVVAHSQGGFVSYLALSDPWSKEVEMYLSFASATPRLTEIEHQQRRGDFLLALVGSFGALVALRFLPATLLGFAGLAEPHPADVFACTVGLLLGLCLIAALWDYFHHPTKVEDLPRPIPWIDFLTTEDPVLNRRRAGILPPRVKQVRVQNEGSLVADHGGYWKNTDEFVPQVAIAVGALDPFLHLPIDGHEHTRPAARKLLRAAYRRRHERVSALRARGSVIVAATIATVGVLLFRPGELDGLGTRIVNAVSALPDFLTSWIPNLAGVLLPIQGIEMIVVGGLAIALLSYLGLSVGSWTWGRWGADATEAEYRGGAPRTGRTALDWPTMFYVAILVQVAALAVIAIVGPIAILDALNSFYGQRDDIVRAWARQFIVTLIVALVAWAWVWWRQWSPRDAIWRIAGGFGTALFVELAIALAVPGPTDPVAAAALGFGIGFLSVLIVWIAWSPLGSLLARIRSRVEVPDREPSGVYRYPASVIDYLGSIGLLLALLGATLVLIVPRLVGWNGFQLANEMHLHRAGAAVGIVGALFGLVLAANGGSVRSARASRWRGFVSRRRGLRRATKALARMVRRKSPTTMRAIGILAFGIGLVAFVVGSVRVLALGGPFG